MAMFSPAYTCLVTQQRDQATPPVQVPSTRDCGVNVGTGSRCVESTSMLENPSALGSAMAGRWSEFLNDEVTRKP